MTRKNVPTMCSLLHSSHHLIPAIQRITNEPENVVVDRLLAEHRCIGTNVRNDAITAKLPPHQWTDQLIEFYRTTKSFLYETAVWNRSPLKQKMRAWIGKFLHRNEISNASVLTYGDGMGFDSTYMALHGFDVTCFEPSEECTRFARDVFSANSVQVRHIGSPDELTDETFDIIICLDVLEHIPSPPDTVAQFSRWLKPGGHLITHSPFFFIEPYHPTHLRSNIKYSGCDWLFRQHGLHPVDGKYFWDPIVLKKSSKTPANRRLTLVRLGKPALIVGRWFSFVHSFFARRMSASESHWIEELEALVAKR